MATRGNNEERDNARPKALLVLPEQIPPDLRGLPHWLVWRYVEKIDAEAGEIHWDKPPMNPRTGRLASSTNSKTWGSFDQALASYQTGRLDGIGFVLHRQKGEIYGLIGIDLDKCRDAVAGKVEEWALQIVQTLNSYTEVSPSGRGLRIFLYGNLPPSGRKKGGYENYQTSRYVTVTGHHVEGTPRTIEARQEEIERVHKNVFGDGAANPNGDRRTARSTVSLSDLELLDLARRAKNGAKFGRLWEGDTSGYPSASEADQALCNLLSFWAGPDGGRIDTLFRQSGLYRAKWERADYREATIGKAIESCTQSYEPGRNGHGSNRRSSRTEAGPPAEEDEAHLTDKGNAKRMILRHGENLRYCMPLAQVARLGRPALAN